MNVTELAARHLETWNETAPVAAPVQFLRRSS